MCPDLGLGKYIHFPQSHLSCPFRPYFLLMSVGLLVALQFSYPSDWKPQQLFPCLLTLYFFFTNSDFT